MSTYNMRIIPASQLPEIATNEMRNVYSMAVPDKVCYGNILKALSMLSIKSIESNHRYIDITFNESDTLINFIKSESNIPIFYALSNTHEFFSMEIPSKLWELVKNGMILDFNK